MQVYILLFNKTNYLLSAISSGAINSYYISSTENYIIENMRMRVTSYNTQINPIKRSNTALKLTFIT